MPSKRRGRRQPLLQTIRGWVGLVLAAGRRAALWCCRAAADQLRQQSPRVIVDARNRDAGHLRSLLTSAARDYAHALDTQLPHGLVIVVQRVVYEGRQLNGLLQTYDGSEGERRHVMHLALSINGRNVGEDELLAALRHQLARVLEDSIGKPVTTVPLDLEVPRAKSGGAIVELRPNAGQESRRSPTPFQRVEDDAA